MRSLHLLALVASMVAVAARDVVVGLPLANPGGLEHRFWQTFTPGSAHYLDYPSQDQIRELVSPRSGSLDAVKDWAAAVGAEVSLRGLGDVAVVRGVPGRHLTAVGELESALGVDFVRLLPNGGEAGEASSSRQARSPLDSYAMNNIKDAYQIPRDLRVASNNTAQMVWGPGTFGYLPSVLKSFASAEGVDVDFDKVVYTTSNHGTPGGDNFMEGTLDVNMITTFGMGAWTYVTNTNTSSSTEEGDGFGLALLDFLTDLSAAAEVPHVLSMSLGSLSAVSCQMLCEGIQSKGYSLATCQAYMQSQRQVCMYMSPAQQQRIDQALQAVALRGVTILGSSGDGGSHFSFEPFSGGRDGIADALNEFSCAHQLPVFPTTSPFLLSVGGEEWRRGNSSDPVAWSSSGGGFSWASPMPTHQTQVVQAYLKAQSAAGRLPPLASFNASGRAYPDLAAVGVEGTSQSCPITAGIFTLVADAREQKGLPRLGFVAPRLWQEAQQHPGELLEDITVGNTKTTCDNGFFATEGWDPITGWGRPIWPGFAKYLGQD